MMGFYDDCSNPNECTKRIKDCPQCKFLVPCPPRDYLMYFDGVLQGKAEAKVAELAIGVELPPYDAKGTQYERDMGGYTVLLVKTF